MTGIGMRDGRWFTVVETAFTVSAGDDKTITAEMVPNQ